MVTTLVTGGSGFIGSHIVRTLVKGCESVRILSRNVNDISRGRRTPGVEYCKGSIFSADDLSKALNGCFALINAAQFDNAPFENPTKGLTYEKFDGDGTLLQIEAAKKAGVTRVIYISGAGTREGRTEPWFRAKIRAEKAVRESGMNWTIFRPSWVYGPEDRSLNKFALFARLLPFVPIIGTGKEKVQPLFVDDLASVVGQALRRSDTYGKTYEIGGPQELTMNEIVKTLLQVQGKRRLILAQPKPLMKAIAFFVQHLPGRPLTPDGIDFVTMEEKVDMTLLQKDFEVTLTPLAVGFASYL